MSYTHLNPMERGQIELLHEQGWSSTAIAARLGRHRTTISRELQRNSTSQGYGAAAAQRCYSQRRLSCRPRSKLRYEPLRDYIAEQIAVHDLSPELAVGRLRLEFPDNPKMRVCAETIYQAIYANRHYMDFLIEYLPQARPKRRKRGQGKSRRGPTIPNRVSIRERPAVVEQRTQHGHWEGDLIVGKNQDGFILTLVERVSRLLHAVKVQTKRAAEVCQAVIEALIDRPITWVRTITFDNGTEFHDHQRIAQELGANIYFADPYSSFQRGSNEQVNGLLRRYLPKGTSFEHLAPEQLQQLETKINNRPRKCLGFRTPLEVFNLDRKNHLRALSS